MNQKNPNDQNMLHILNLRSEKDLLDQYLCNREEFVMDLSRIIIMQIQKKLEAKLSEQIEDFVENSEGEIKYLEGSKYLNIDEFVPQYLIDLLKNKELDAEWMNELQSLIT